MSTSPTTPSQTRLPSKVESGIDRVILSFIDDGSETSLTGLEKELYEVLVASDAFLRTIDLERVPDSIDIEALRERIDVDRLAEAIEEYDPDVAVDLSNLETVIDTRAVLSAIDLLEFVRAKKQLDKEVKDVLGDARLSGVGTDSKAGADISDFVSVLRSEAKESLLQQEAAAKATAVQEAILESHSVVERKYAANKRRITNASDQRITRNSTAVSLLSSGPLPDSISTRLSLVPSKVLYSKADSLPRIYSRRWTKAGSKRAR